MQEPWSSWHLQMQEKHIFVFVSSCEFDAVKDGGLTWGKTTSRNWTTQRFGGKKRDPGMYYRSLWGPIAHLLSYWRSFVCQKSQVFRLRTIVKLKNMFKQKCKWKHHAPEISWSFIGCLGKKRLTCKWKKRAQTNSTWRTYCMSSASIAEPIWTWIPPIAKCRQRRLPTFMVALLTARNDIWKSKKIESLWWKKKSGGNLESFCKHAI